MPEYHAKMNFAKTLVEKPTKNKVENQVRTRKSAAGRRNPEAKYVQNERKSKAKAF